MPRTPAIRPLLTAGTALLLAACSMATPYQPLNGPASSDTAGGYSSRQIAPDRYQVTFQGNRYASRERVENYLLFRAAELTRQKGYPAFRVVRRDTDRDVDQRLVERPAAVGLGYGGFSPYWSFGGGFGSALYDPFVGGPFYADTVDVQTIDKYEATATIELLRQPAAGPQSYVAADVLARLRDRIELPD